MVRNGNNGVNNIERHGSKMAINGNNEIMIINIINIISINNNNNEYNNNNVNNTK
jgi:hypothetical protein